VSGLNPVEYKQRGSSELAFLSLTKRKSVAEKYVDETLSGRNPEWTKPGVDETLRRHDAS